MDHNAAALHAAIDEVLAGHRDAFRHIVREHGLAGRAFTGVQANTVAAFALNGDVERGEGRILVRYGDIKDFHIHVIFATDKVIAGKPDQVRAFLKGWFETIAFMRKNKDETVAIAMEVTGKDKEITSSVYDELMPMFSDTGKFDPAALATLRKSYVELNLLPTEPDMSKLYNEAFLPK